MKCAKIPVLVLMKQNISTKVIANQHYFELEVYASNYMYKSVK